MSSSRDIFQAKEKINAICSTLCQAGALERATVEKLAVFAGVSYQTLKSASQKGRLSDAVEQKIAAAAKFDRAAPEWVDERVPASERRKIAFADYGGRDTLERFRTMLSGIWEGPRIRYVAETQEFQRVDPHMLRHELSDLGQTTPSGSTLPFILTVNVRPFYHESGIAIGFRKLQITVSFGCNGPRAQDRLGYPDPLPIGDALLTGDSMSRDLEWCLERPGDQPGILSGEYSTSNDPLLTLSGYRDGTTVISRIDVNLYDRTTWIADGAAALSTNKQALIEQIFSSELKAGKVQRGWITLSEQTSVIARFG